MFIAFFDYSSLIRLVNISFIDETKIPIGFVAPTGLALVRARSHSFREGLSNLFFSWSLRQRYLPVYWQIGVGPGGGFYLQPICPVDLPTFCQMEVSVTGGLRLVTDEAVWDSVSAFPVGASLFYSFARVYRGQRCLSEQGYRRQSVFLDNASRRKKDRFFFFFRRRRVRFLRYFPKRLYRKFRFIRKMRALFTARALHTNLFFTIRQGKKFFFASTGMFDDLKRGTKRKRTLMAGWFLADRLFSRVNAELRSRAVFTVRFTGRTSGRRGVWFSWRAKLWRLLRVYSRTPLAFNGTRACRRRRL